MHNIWIKLNIYINKIAVGSIQILKKFIEILPSVHFN